MTINSLKPIVFIFEIELVVLHFFDHPKYLMMRHKKL
jgi:hypothetical protein